MKVWRVAHSEARYQDFPSGPYIEEGLPEKVDQNIDGMRWAHGDRSRPEPHHDASLQRILPRERCGFDSESALYEWFKGYEELLRENGFKVWVYEVPDDKVRVGNFGQALFDQDHLALVDSYDFKKEMVG
ncbi:hypothetical protein ACIPJG_32205 [Streptomyces halstedii]|uniref:hypothetical protein n=1 Tax=Streptomyces halstedii TaxID=1944 RepID=UPI00380E3BFD